MDTSEIAPVHASDADDYDLLPYPSMPYANTQPARLAALAELYGIPAPAPERARVLELGCASAGNIIPLAARFPQAQFLGVDLARRHIDEANRRIGALGLSNIEARQGDLTELNFGAGAFDYIICHGVFSWVPQAAQDAILRICGHSLSRSGVALISYNVLPGWRLRGAIRDICVRHAGFGGAPKARVDKARAILSDIAASANPGDPYGLLLRNEARRIARRPASYILGEFLVANNEPCFFADFAARARAHGLGYVCESDLEASVSNAIAGDVRAKLTSHAGEDPIAIEQYIDYFTGRTFRSSVLARADAPIGRRAYEPIRQLHIAAEFRADPSGGPHSYKDSRGRALACEDGVVNAALSRLAAARPATMTFAEMLDASAGEDAAQLLQAALAGMLQRGQITVSTQALRVGRAAARYPKAWALARAEAAAGKPWMTSLAHAAVALRPAVAALVPHLDGGKDNAALTAIFSAALGRGEIKAPELDDVAAPPDTAVHQAAASYVERVLKYLEFHAVLVPDESQSFSTDP